MFVVTCVHTQMSMCVFIDVCEFACGNGTEMHQGSRELTVGTVSPCSLHCLSHPTDTTHAHTQTHTLSHLLTSVHAGHVTHSLCQVGNYTL